MLRESIGQHQLARLASRCGLDDPDVVGDAVRVHVGRADGVNNGPSVRRNLRLADALHTREVVERHRMFRWSLRPRGRSQDGQEKNESHRAGFELHGSKPFRGPKRSRRFKNDAVPEDHTILFLSPSFHFLPALLVKGVSIGTPDRTRITARSVQDHVPAI